MTAPRLPRRVPVRGSRRTPVRNAFSLVEMLCVVTLSALAVALLAPGLAGSSAAARWIEAEALAARADRTGRALARTDGPVDLAVLPGGATITLTAADGRTPISAYALPRGVRCELTLATAAGSPRFDAAGRSCDYRITLTSHARRGAWTVSGISGWRTPDPIP